MCGPVGINSSTSTAGLKAANMALKKADIVYFGDLWLEKGKDLSVDGHFIFDEEFVDSLAENRLIIKFSSRYMRKRASWGPGGYGRTHQNDHSRPRSRRLGCLEKRKP